MDQFILTHSDKAQIHISYSSIYNSRDQYHRNANLPVQSNDLIKLPVYLYALEQLELGLLDAEEAFRVRQERLIVNATGMFGTEDTGRMVSTLDIMQAIIQFGDNAACNILLSRLGKKSFQQKLSSYKLNNLYLLGDLDDRTKHKTERAKNFIATGDLVNYQKKLISELSQSRKGRDLLIDNLLAYNIDESIKLEDVTTINLWRENTKLCKGVNYLASGEKGFIMTILISNFTNESVGEQLLEKAEQIYFTNIQN